MLQPVGPIDRKHKGAFAETLACAWLLQRGWEVFRNVSSHGEYDLIIHNPSTLALHKVQVKTPILNVISDGSLRSSTGNWMGCEGAYTLVVFPNGGCQWLSKGGTATVPAKVLENLPETL